MSDLKIGDRVTGIKGNTRVTGTVMNIKEGHVHIKAPVSGVYAPLVSIVPLHKVTKLGEGAMKRKAEAEDDAGMSDYMHHVQTSSAPFDGAKPAKPHQDQFGNKIKIGNVAKNLAKQGMRGIKKEEVESIDEWRHSENERHSKRIAKGMSPEESHAKMKKTRDNEENARREKRAAAKLAKEEVEQIDEVGPQKRLKRVFNKLRDARAGAAYKQSGMPVPDREPGHKNTVDHNKALGRALRKMSEDLHSRKVYEPTSAQELNPGLRARIDAASNAQKPAPAGSRPIGKIKLMTRKEEVEQVDEAERTKAQIAAVNNRKAGRELGAKVAQEYHDNVRAKGIHVGHPEHTELYNKHTDKMSYLTLKRKHSETRANHMSNAAHDTFHSNIRKLHDTAMKKDPGYKAKYEQHQADRAKRSAKAEIEYQAANAKIDKLRGEHHTGSPSHIEAINKVRKEHGHEITQSALYNHYGDGDGNLPTWAGGHGTNAERAKHHYNMYVAGTGGHGDRGYRYEEVEQVEEGYKGRRAFGSAYDKTHDPFQDSKSRFKSRELEHELAHEAPSGPAHHDQTPHDVHIDGKKWKTFGSAGHAHNVANKLSISGKRASVHKTPIAEKAPPGWEGTVKAMKKHPEIDNPYALAWWMKRKGAKSHKGEK